DGSPKSRKSRSNRSCSRSAVRTMFSAASWSADTNGLRFFTSVCSRPAIGLPSPDIHHANSLYINYIHVKSYLKNKLGPEMIHSAPACCRLSATSTCILRPKEVCLGKVPSHLDSTHLVIGLIGRVVGESADQTFSKSSE